MSNSNLPEANHALADGADSAALLERASAYAGRGFDALLAGTNVLRNQARHASDRGVDHIREEPVKSVLIAAAAGAALMALIGLFTRSRSRR